MNSVPFPSPIPSGELGTREKKGNCLDPGKEMRWGSVLPVWAGQGAGGGGAWEGPGGTPERLCHRALRLVHVCMAVEPLARIIRVILQSVPDMANIMTLILFFMLVSALPCPQSSPSLSRAPGSLGIQGCLEEEERPMGLNPCHSLGGVHLHGMCMSCSQGPWVKSRHLLWFLWQVFSVFGVTLFGAFVPMHFQNMQVALYTLFICITQDGWVDIYRDFQ